MKTLIKFGTVVLAAGALVASPPLAVPQQYSTKNPSAANTQGVVAFAGGANRLELLINILSLTASQQAQAKAILDDEEAASRPFIEQVKQAFDALESAEKTAAGDQEIDQLATNLAAISGQLLTLDARAAAKIYAQLTPEQKQKLDQLPHPPFLLSAPLLPPIPLLPSSASFFGAIPRSQ